MKRINSTCHLHSLLQDHAADICCAGGAENVGHENARHENARHKNTTSYSPTQECSPVHRESQRQRALMLCIASRAKTHPPAMKTRKTISKRPRHQLQHRILHHQRKHLHATAVRCARRIAKWSRICSMRLCSFLLHLLRQSSRYDYRLAALCPICQLSLIHI